MLLRRPTTLATILYLAAGELSCMASKINIWCCFGCFGLALLVRLQAAEDIAGALILAERRCF